MNAIKVNRVVVAPSAFKGTMGPLAVATAMAEGVRRVWPRGERMIRPVSDGGNGLLEVCRAMAGGVMERRTVSGPLGSRVDAHFLIQDDTVVIESAEACGLHLVPTERRDPLRATTRGVGELLLAARERAASQVILGLGGSATVDGGTGMARALGWRLQGSRGAALGEGGAALAQLERIERPPDRYSARVTALCDVHNPLLGRLGAATVYGPQKGASQDDVLRLEEGLRRLSEVVQRDLGVEVSELPGAGAAGGLGAGAHAFLGAQLVSGADWVLERGNFRSLLPGADLVVTGEGRFDEQSGMGKVTGKILELAEAVDTPALLVCGRVAARPRAGLWVAEGEGGLLSRAGLVDLTEAACRRLA